MNDKDIYFIGIGGIGMSALARWFKKQKYYVAGYDLMPTPLTSKLSSEGIDIVYQDDPALIPQKIKKSPQNTLVIYTPAIPQNNQIYTYFINHNFQIKKRAEVLGEISKEYFSIAVAGTHGKTTISSLIAHILTHTGYGCNAFLGGISLDYNTNLLLSNKKVLVIEADEYDKSFLKLSPDIAIITAIDSDHLDIYNNHNNLKNTFIQFANKVPVQGSLIFNDKIKNLFKDIIANKITYGLESKNNNVYAYNIQYEADSTIFDVRIFEEKILNIKIPLLGKYNIDNVIAAISVAKLLKIDNDKIKKALISFSGIQRRGQKIIQNNKTLFIDDYAHHPVEITALLQSIKTNYPNKKITIIFQPHLYSRTKDLAKDFAESLSYADNIILTDIYAARENPLEGVTSETITKYLNKKYFCVNTTFDILNLLKEIKPEILLTVGAGDIYKHIDSIKQLIDNEYL